MGGGWGLRRCEVYEERSFASLRMFKCRVLLPLNILSEAKDLLPIREASAAS